MPGRIQPRFHFWICPRATGRPKAAGIMFAAAALAIQLIFATSECVFADEKSSAANQEAQLQFFETRIRPVLVEQCYSCHSAESKDIRGGLLLDTRAGLLNGGDSGPALIPGKPNDSILIAALKHETVEMPPDQKLSDDVIRDFETWIANGATDPRDGEAKVTKRTIDVEKGREFWSFHPVTNPTVPVAGDGWALGEIDRFLADAHQRKFGAESVVAADASPDVILRRLTLVLTGLLPTPDEQRSFATAYDNDAQSTMEATVDRLLESPRFGERWGRHWLDVARYAESTGGGRSMMLPDAWRFRDYVIRSFNQDKPFQQLVREHLAGDLLPYESNEQHDEQVIGSGYLMLGAINYEEQDKEQLRMDVVDEQIDTMGRSFLGMTLGCCRCHDHKFDPIPAADYYALAGIFRSTKSLTPGNVCGFVTRPLKNGYDKSAVAAWTDEDKKLESKIAALRKKIALAGKNVARVSNADRPSAPALSDLDGIVVDDSSATLAGTWVDSQFQQPHVGDGYRHSGQPRTGISATYEAKLPSDGEYLVRMVVNHGESRSEKIPLQIVHSDGETIVHVNQKQGPDDGIFATLGRFRFEAARPAKVVVQALEASPGYVICDAIQFIPLDQAARLAAATSASDDAKLAEGMPIDETRLKALQKELKAAEEARKAFEKQKPDIPVAMSVEDEQQPADWHLHIRGEIRNLGPIVPRGYIQVATPVGQSTSMMSTISSADSAAAAGPSSGRLQLANWVASADNPLTARVYVNRVWQNVFGEGLVRTPDNFGETGERPDLPELLDYLAFQFVHRHQWSTKRLIRELCLSRAFRMSSTASDKAVAADVENRLLTHSHRRRLDAEALRDALLQVSGELDFTVTSGRTIAKLGTYDNEYHHVDHPMNVRSIFVPAFRNSVLDLFEIFDGANPNLVSGKRTRSTRPAQALYLLNSPFVMSQAEKAAKRFVASKDLLVDDPEQTVRNAVRVCLCREASSDEIGTLVNLIGDQPTSEAVWTQIFHALFASVDFRFVD